MSSEEMPPIPKLYEEMSVDELMADPAARRTMNEVGLEMLRTDSQFSKAFQRDYQPQPDDQDYLVPKHGGVGPIMPGSCFSGVPLQQMMAETVRRLKAQEQTIV